MSRRSRSVLFVSHDASRTGAPGMLLELLRWLRQNTAIPFEIALGQGGPLEEEFRALARVTCLSSARPLADLAPRRWPMAERWLRRVNDRAFRLRQRPGRFGLVYCNTAASGSVVRALGHPSIPFIAHIHELEVAIHTLAGLDSFQILRRRCGHFIVASEPVRQNLIDRHGLPPEQVQVIQECVPAHAAQTLDCDALRLRLRRELGLPADALVVGAAGTTDWRKGPDLFIQLARHLVQSQTAEEGRRPVHFVWLGAPDGGPVLLQLQHDVCNCGLAPLVRFLPSRAGAIEAIAGFDVLALTSREDPFPLVMLEAAAVGVPTVCFERAGGAPEFVGSDCGTVVPYLDVPQMARCIQELLLSDPRRRQLGQNATAKVLARNDVGVIAPQIAAVIQRHLDANVP